MKNLFALLLMIGSLSALAQSWNRNGAIASTAVAPTGNILVSPAGGTIRGAQTICLYPSNAIGCGQGWPSGVDIFYTTDGSAPTPASTWYGCKTNPTGCISLPAPLVARTVTIRSVLVQTSNPVTGAQGVIVQDGTNVQSRLKLNLSCTSAQCAGTVFTNPFSNTQYGNVTSPANGNNGVRGVPPAVGYHGGMSQPSVDLYTTTSSAVDYLMSTAGSTVSSGPNTEILINYDTSTQGLSSTGCVTCTNFDISRYIAHDYETTSSTSLPNAAAMGDLESDDNLYDSSRGTSTQCGKSPTVACYGAFNFRCAPADLTVTVNGVKYGGYQHSSQTSDWRSFGTAAAVIPSHDCTYPFGTITALSNSSGACAFTFTPGSLKYNSQMSWGLDNGAFLVVDFGKPTVETIEILQQTNNIVSQCIRGVGGTPQTHSGTILAAEFVLFQAGASKDTTLAAGGSAAATCEYGTREPVAMYYNYLASNGVVYGTAAAQAMLSGYTVADTWGTQTVNGTAHSVICDYYGLSPIFDYGTGRFFDQIQPYTKLAAGVSATIGILTQHDNFTAHFGIIGTPSVVVYTQAPSS